jgi:hypothetical protein
MSFINPSLKVKVFLDEFYHAMRIPYGFFFFARKFLLKKLLFFSVFFVFCAM